MNVLQMRGLSIASQQGHVRHIGGGNYVVRSQSHPGWYDVSWNGRRWYCQCKFNQTTHVVCKHIYAVMYTIGPARRLGDEDDPRCPACGGTAVIKRGVYKNKSGFTQCYGCKTCRIRFVPKSDFNGMRHRASVIVSAIDLYFKGLSLRKISDHLGQQYGLKVTHQTIYRWIVKYLGIMRARADSLIPNVSGVWHADETIVRVRSRHRYQWNLMDGKTRFLIATHLSKRRDANHARKLLENGIASARATPKALVTDGLGSYSTATRELEDKHSIEVNHIAGAHLPDNNRVERLHNTMRERTKTMRALDNMRSAQTFAENYRLYYNFIRPHEGLGGATPAEAAGIQLKKAYNRWLQLLN